MRSIVNKVIKLLSLVWLPLLIACNESDDSNENSTSRGQSNVISLDMLGFWLGSTINGETDDDHAAFIGESGFTFLRSEGSILYGTLEYDQFTGVGNLFQIVEETTESYQVTVTIESDNTLMIVITDGVVSSSLSFVQDINNNPEFKKGRDISDYDGFWHLAGSTEIITMLSGEARFSSFDSGCDIHLVMEEANYLYSEFPANIQASNCLNSSFDGMYQGVVVSGQDEEGDEDWGFFVYKNDAWMSASFLKE